MSPSIRCANIVDHTPPPPGVKAYVTGAAPLVTDQFEVGRHGTLKTTLITLGVIAVMLFWLYRRLTTVFLVIFTVMIELTASRGVVAVLANAGIIELSTYSTNLLTLLVIAAGTDYAIFILGRFHEARHAGQDRVSAFNTMYHGTAHIILGSGLTIAGAVLCLTFTRLPYFQSLGVPAGIGVLVAVVAALTLAPALLSHRPPFRSVRTRPPDAHPGLAAHRHGHRPLARAHPGGDDRHRSHRSARPAGIQDELRRSPVHARQCPGQCRLRGRRTPLLAGPAQSRIVDDRSRPRSTQFHRHDPAGARRQGGLPHRRHRSGAIDHPAAGHALGPHVDTVPDQRGERVTDQQPALPAGPRPPTCSSRSA